LLEAEIIFRRLREERQHQNLAVAAELASLEASLCIDQRRFSDAERLLVRAIGAFRCALDPNGEARTCIQLGNLLRTTGRPGDALVRHAQAAALIDAEVEPYLFVCTVTGRVNALCDLDRAADAEPLLATHAASYAACDDVFLAHHCRMLQGRVALGLGRCGEAQGFFRTTRDAYLELGRDYDAILVSLYLADTLLAAGKMSQLRRLATDLIPLFRSRGVARETLASLRLLAQAVTAETVSAAVLEKIRRQLETSEHPPHERPVTTAE